MTFFADEGLDAPLVELLRKEGHSVLYAAEEMSGATDIEILTKATEQNAILITKDKDFGEMIVRHRMNSNGVVLIRVEKLNSSMNCMFIVRLINKHAPELHNCFTVIQEDKIRIRAL
jgi:predicted nuclease of predicted toxin-antitoxin system